jgi:hypothetical protein
VREASDGSAHEIVTLDHVRPLRPERSFATMPVQAVYYRLTDSGVEEVGRGEIYDGEDEPWKIPRAIEPFLDPTWVRERKGL